MIAADLMTAQPLTVRCEDEITTAVSLLQRPDVRHLPVLNERDELVGMLSESDLKSLNFPHALGQEGAASVAARTRAPVATLLSDEPVCVSMEDDASVIVERMARHGVSAVAVVDAASRLVGIVSSMDLLRHYVEEERRWATARRASQRRTDLPSKAHRRGHRLAAGLSQGGV